MTQLSRRRFLSGLVTTGAVLAVPAIIKTPGLLMPVRPERLSLLETGEFTFTASGDGMGDRQIYVVFRKLHLPHFAERLPNFSVELILPAARAS